MKSELSQAAYQYAVAVFEIATDQTIADVVLSDLENINKTLESITDFKTVLNHPSIPALNKKKLLVEQFKDQVQELTLRLIEMLVDRRRVELLTYIESQYRERLTKSKGIVRATLVSAQAISTAQADTVKMTLVAKLGKTLELEVKVDPSLIAGMRLAIGDQILDGSVKTKLENLERSLLST